ncbi:MAG TPA: transposase [Candidatus Saccharimonadales bacterium]|nr:transposase [Candidatus Saccharimonadales bacterium]
MPSPNTIKTYIENGYYHVYNRGVEKRRIFEETRDYQRFVNYFKLYLSPIESLRREDPLLRSSIVNANLSDQVDLLAYCLMPNHFHILLKQRTKDGMTKLMRQISTGYSMYFNKKYERVGALFQGIFKACLVENEDYLLHLSRYIHQNPKDRGVSLSDFQWSSYSAYMRKSEQEWLKPQDILGYFSTTNAANSYKNFVEENLPGEQNLSLDHLIME